MFAVRCRPKPSLWGHEKEGTFLGIQRSWASQETTDHSRNVKDSTQKADSRGFVCELLLISDFVNRANWVLLGKTWLWLLTFVYIKSICLRYWKLVLCFSVWTSGWHTQTLRLLRDLLPTMQILHQNDVPQKKQFYFEQLWHSMELYQILTNL